MGALRARINELMAEKKITAVDIEKATGLKRNTVYSITAGTSKNPSVHNLQLIAKALNVSMETLMLDGGTVGEELLTAEQMNAFGDSAKAVASVAASKDYHFNMDKLIFLIKEVYQYSIKISPPAVDERFIHWLLDKHKPQN